MAVVESQPDPTIEPRQPDRSLSELVSDMTSDLSTLMRKEVELAREEIKEEVAKARTAGVSFGGAAVAGLLTGVALVLTLGYTLDIFMPAWAAFLVVTLVLGAVAAAFATKGKREVQELNPKPEQTIETLKEDAQWLSERRS
ncbi:MAG: sle [Acidimicrobiales bacterium]|nr:sle [Acidimicrobiales bacterium]